MLHGFLIGGLITNHDIPNENVLQLVESGGRADVRIYGGICAAWGG